MSYHLALALDHRARSEEALEYFERSVVREPSFFFAHYNYAIALGKVGRLSDACRQIHAAAEINAEYIYLAGQRDNFCG